MDKLPAEILAEIFQHLHLKQKLECILVCNTWAQVLRDSYLFEALYLAPMSSYKSFYKRVDRLTKATESGQGQKCNRLVFINNGNILINGAAFARSFPNLKYLYFHEYVISKREDSFDLSFADTDLCQGWRNSLETFFADCFIKNYILDCLFIGTFNRLTTLSVLCTGLLDCPLSPKEFYQKLISKLENMPVLSTLTIKSEDLSIMDLEEIHKKAPGLTSLTLREGFCTELEDIRRLKIIPTEKLKVFKTVEFYSEGPVLDTLLLYAKLKYTHLDEFYHYETHHRHNFSMSTPVFSNLIWVDFISAIGPRLSKCTITLKHKATEIFNIMETHLNQIESLNVDVFRFKKMFKRMMSNPTFFNLRSLVLRQLPPGFKMSDFKNLTKLHELTLDLSRNSTMYDNGQLYPITLNSIINELPKNVEKLTLGFANIAINNEAVQNESRLTYFSLLDSHVLDPNTSDYLSRYFPSLKSLVLQKCKSIQSLKLPNHHLSHFELIPPNDCTYLDEFTAESIRQCELENIHMKITALGHTLHYKFPVVESRYSIDPCFRLMDSSNYSMQNVLRATEYDKELTYFHLECDKVDTAYFYSYRLL